MDDRTLLERAAKAAAAAGMSVIQSEAGPQILQRKTADAEFYRQWAPLADDGDEARLEAACGLNVLWGDTCVTVVHYLADIGCTEFFDDHGDDKSTARRRAGVRAAAEIGGE